MTFYVRVGITIWSWFTSKTNSVNFDFQENRDSLFHHLSDLKQTKQKAKQNTKRPE